MNLWRVAIDEVSGRVQGELEPITSPASFAAHLSISSGGLLAYSAVLETQNIQKLRLDPGTGDVLGEPLPVTTGSRLWANPDPSPDGEWVVFYSQVGPEGDLYVARSDGSGVLRRLTDDIAIDRVPRWSPDGEWIAMFSDRSGDLGAWMVRADGSELQQVIPAPSTVEAWSPDGQRLAVARGTETPGPGGHLSAAIVDPHLSAFARTPAALPVAPAPDPRFVPNSWSPDGQWLVGQHWYEIDGVSVYSLNTRTYDRLIEVCQWPVWLPDSRRILFVSGGREFHLLDVDTRTTRQIFSVQRDSLGPPRLSLDGREIYFSRRVTDADV